MAASSMYSTACSCSPKLISVPFDLQAALMIDYCYKLDTIMQTGCNVADLRLTRLALTLQAHALEKC